LPDLAASLRPGPQLPGLVVEVSKFGYDCEIDGNPGDLTEQRLSLMGDALYLGAWFLNPIYLVKAPSPSIEFYKAARQARSRWLDWVRQSLRNHGLRSQARQAEWEGRKAALVSFDQPDNLDDDPRFISPPTHLSGLTPEQRREVLQSGRFAKQLGYTGMMIIDGEVITAKTWHRWATDLIHPNRPEITTAHRKVFLNALKANGDTEHLKQMAREALQAQLDAYPTHAAYVSPQVTVSAPTATPAFYAAARTSQARWCTLLNRTLGCGNVRRARRASDPATVSLVFSGTLLVGGQVYLPQCWPTHAPKPGRLKKTPFQAPTVPPEFLGLNPSNEVDAREQRNAGPGTDRGDHGTGQASPGFRHPAAVHIKTGDS